MLLPIVDFVPRLYICTIVDDSSWICGERVNGGVGKNLCLDVWRPDFAFGYVVAVFASEEADLCWRRLFGIGSLRRRWLAKTVPLLK